MMKKNWRSKISFELSLSMWQSHCSHTHFNLCAVSVGCGSTGRENITYYVSDTTASSSSSSTPSSCVYTVCPVSNNICKMRLDFTTFQIAGPSTVTLGADGITVVVAEASKIGGCNVDLFQGTVSLPSSVTYRTYMNCMYCPSVHTYYKFAILYVSFINYSHPHGLFPKTICKLSN